VKILTKNTVTSVSANLSSTGGLTEFLGENAKHKPDLVLNDYPTAQWVAGLPDFVTDDTEIIGRKIISHTLTAYGRNWMNGVYLGNFQGDKISYMISKWIPPTEDNNGDPVAGFYKPVLPTTAGASTEQTIPVYVYDTLSHLVRGEPTAYRDYLLGLEDLKFEDAYLDGDFKIDITIGANQNMLKEQDYGFVSQSIENLSYQDVEGRQYWKIRGNFINPAGEVIGVDDDVWGTPLQVGTTFISYFSDEAPDPSNNVTETSRLIQIVEIVGDGTKESAISLVIRSFENNDTSNTPIETLLEDLYTDLSSVTIDSVPFSEQLTLTYMFKSIRLGLLRAGYMEIYPNPQVGMSRSYKDFSIRKSLVNGGHQYSNRNIAKIYSGNLTLKRVSAVGFLRFAEDIRAKPFPVEILTNMEMESPTVFYGFFVNTPSENMSYRTGVMREIDFSIQQVF